MNNNLKEYLDKINVGYKEYKHPSIFTVEEGKPLKEHIPCMHTKSLFLKDEKSIFYLVCMPGEKRLNITFLEKHLKVKKIKFASPEELKKELNLDPGSVSIFGMINSTRVKLILDKELWDSDSVGFHPNINTSTLVLKQEALKKFYDSLTCKKEVLEIEQKTE